MNDDKKIYEKYEKKISELEERYKIKSEKEIKSIKKKHFIKLFVFIGIIITILTIPLIILGIEFGKNSLGWFENYDGMYKTELPIENPAKGGTLYLPNEWEFREENGWYSIYNVDTNMTIAIEAYHGYEYFIKGPSEYEWVNYEVNPKAQECDYDNLKFDFMTNTSNNCAIVKANNIQAIYFMDTCFINKRRYSRIYLLTSNVDFDILKKIDNSYSWAGDVNI